MDEAARRAGKKLEKYKLAVKETKVTPQRWRLDENQGGGFLKAPSAYATLVVSESGYRLELEKCLPVYGRFDGSNLGTTVLRDTTRAAHWQKLWRQRTLRESNRVRLRGSKARVLKKPAAAV